MSSDSLSDEDIVESWRKNVRPWIKAVREGQIESRREVTDPAILDAVLSRRPRSVLDVGCGEGWLARQLAAENIHVIGIDAVPGLVEEARRANGGDFRLLSYEEVIAGTLRVSVDAAVCNFSLLGKESVEGIVRIIPSLLNPQGTFIVQTLHPVIACGDLPYRDGWRKGSWAGFSSDFTDPAPWYFRTVESWVRLLAAGGFRLLELREPVYPKTLQPASMIFLSEVAGRL